MSLCQQQSNKKCLQPQCLSDMLVHFSHTDAMVHCSLCRYICIIQHMYIVTAYMCAYSTQLALHKMYMQLLLWYMYTFYINIPVIYNSVLCFIFMRIFTSTNMFRQMEKCWYFLTEVLFQVCAFPFLSSLCLRFTLHSIYYADQQWMQVYADFIFKSLEENLNIVSIKHLRVRKSQMDHMICIAKSWEV